MRLPIEVRNHIYNMLVSSMFDTADNYYPKLSVAPRIRFVLRILNWQPDPESTYEYEFKVTSRYPPDDPRNDANHFLDLYKAIKDGSLDITDFNPYLRNWKREMMTNVEEIEEEEYDGETSDSDEFDLADSIKKKSKSMLNFMDTKQIAIYCENNVSIPPKSRSPDHQEDSSEDRSSARKSLFQVHEMELDLGDECNSEMGDCTEMCEPRMEIKGHGDIGGTEGKKTEEDNDEIGLNGGEEKRQTHLEDVHKPERGFRVEIDYNQQTTGDHPHTERVFYDYEEVRRLTHVSRQFSREVGACLWHNSVLELEDYEIPSLFIENRPEALQHIKGIVLNLCYHGSGCLNSSAVDLEKLFNWMSKNLELRFIMINLQTQLIHLPDFVKGKLDDWTVIFRRSKPMERFHVRLVFYRSYTPPSYVIERYYCRPIKKRMERIIGDLWMPDCLREERNGEKRFYVQSRPT